MSHFSPLPESSDFSPLPESSAGLSCSGVSGPYFHLEGEFQGFVSGKTSPFKYLLVKTATEEVRIKLKKSLRMMLFRYLVPGDWIRVVGRQKWDGDRDEITLKADEVVRTTPSLHPYNVEGSSVSPLSKDGLRDGNNNKPHRSKNKSKAKSPKILICQKSGCRKRGGAAVGEMVERSLSELGLSDQVSVKYTGCMDRCKAGPNMVFMPAKAKYSRVEPGTVPDLVRQHFPVAKCD